MNNKDNQQADVNTKQWRCFHCDESFIDKDKAAEHFGTHFYQEPACTIDIEKFREMEAYVARAREEDTDTDRAMYGLRNQHQVDLMREEEKGYAKGLRDALIHADECGNVVVNKAELDALRLDAERLNYLDSLTHRFYGLEHTVINSLSSDIHFGKERVSVFIRTFKGTCEQQGHSDNIRAAIDKARTQS